MFFWLTEREAANKIIADISGPEARFLGSLEGFKSTQLLSFSDNGRNASLDKSVKSPVVIA